MSPATAAQQPDLLVDQPLPHDLSGTTFIVGSPNEGKTALLIGLGERAREQGRETVLFGAYTPDSQVPWTTGVHLALTLSEPKIVLIDDGDIIESMSEFHNDWTMLVKATQYRDLGHDVIMTFASLATLNRVGDAWADLADHYLLFRFPGWSLGGVRVHSALDGMAWPSDCYLAWTPKTGRMLFHPIPPRAFDPHDYDDMDE